MSHAVACFMLVESPVRVEKSVGPHVNQGMY